MPGSSRKDYLDRQVEGVARLVAKLLGLRDAGQPDQASQELEQGARSMLGIGMGPLARVDAASAVGLLRSKARADAYADLLEAEAELDAERADALRERARQVRDLASETPLF